MRCPKWFTYSRARWAPSTSLAISPTKSSKSERSSGLLSERDFHSDTIPCLREGGSEEGGREGGKEEEGGREGGGEEWRKGGREEGKVRKVRKRTREEGREDKMYKHKASGTCTQEH